MSKSFLDRRRMPLGRLLAVPALAGALALAAGPAAAQADLTAHYTVRHILIPISFATGTLRASVPGTGRYSVDFDASGIGFQMSGNAIGVRYPEGLSPLNASIDSQEASETIRIRLAMMGGKVRRESVTPPLPYRPDRVPILPEHREGVIDPLTAMLMPLAKKTEYLEPTACDRTLPVFEGTARFDIRMSYLRTEMVKTLKGYEGPAVVCRAAYKPISGHRPKSAAFWENNRTIEVWLAPIEGTQMLAPWKISLETAYGTMLVEAIEFVSSLNPTKHADADGVSGNGTAR